MTDLSVEQKKIDVKQVEILLELNQTSFDKELKTIDEQNIDSSDQSHVRSFDPVGKVTQMFFVRSIEKSVDLWTIHQGSEHADTFVAQSDRWIGNQVCSTNKNIARRSSRVECNVAAGQFACRSKSTMIFVFLLFESRNQLTEMNELRMELNELSDKNEQLEREVGRTIPSLIDAQRKRNVFSVKLRRKISSQQEFEQSLSKVNALNESMTSQMTTLKSEVGFQRVEWIEF